MFVWLPWADVGHKSSLRLPDDCMLSLNVWLSAACSHSSWIQVLEETVLLEKAHFRAQGGQWVSPSSQYLRQNIKLLCLKHHSSPELDHVMLVPASSLTGFSELEKHA